MSIKLQCNSLADLSFVAEEIIKIGESSKVWFFEGEMAAGKTTLIKAICGQLGVTSSVQSPTYSLVNEYVAQDNNTIYHFDFYRLNSEKEALDYGIEEYFDSDNLCLCEWPSMIPSLWPQKYMTVGITINENESRNIELNFVG